MTGRALAVAAAAATAGVIAFILVQISTVSRDGVEVGVSHASACAGADAECLPDISARDTSGAEWTPESMDGKVVMINFWATWCRPCQQEIPALAEAYERYKDRGFVLLGVMTDRPSDARLEAFADAHGLSYPVVRATRELSAAFDHPSALPTTFVYDRGGQLQLRRRGPMDGAELDAILGDLVAEAPPEPADPQR